MLLLKLWLVPAFLLGLTLAGKRWGPSVAGWLAGLPVVAGPILFFVSLERGAPFAANAAAAALSAVLASVAFSVAYAQAAQRHAWTASLALALTAWLVAAIALSALPASAVLSLVVALASLVVAPRWFPRVASLTPARALDVTELACRMAAGAVLTLSVTWAAGTLGPAWSGLLAVFPLLGSVLAVFSHRAQGAPFAAHLLRGMATGLYAFVAFCFALSLALPRVGIAGSFALAALLSLAVQAASRTWLTLPSGGHATAGERSSAPASAAGSSFAPPLVPFRSITSMPRPLPRILPTGFALAIGAALAACSNLPPAPPSAASVDLQRVASFDHQVTGVAVTPAGRTFVNFPRWTEDSEVSVAELRDGRLVPFPDAGWNAWRNARKDEVSPKNHWVCVQSVVAGPNGNLWVLDPAAPAMGAVVKDGPKLVEIDLRTNLPARVIAFADDIAPQGSYLNDVRFSPDGRSAYLTDSGARGALIVVDLSTGRARRVLDGDPTTQPDPSVTVTVDGKPLRRPDGRGVDFAADGIALSVDGNTLYWQAIKGKTLYSIATDVLRNASTGLASKVKVVGENGPADGLTISRADGRMYITSPQDDSIKVRDLRSTDSKPVLLVQDPRLRWPDSFAEGPDGSLYVTTSHIQDSAFYKPGAPAALPTELWRFRPAKVK